MTSSRILIKPDVKNRGALEPAPATGWYLLGGIGLVFTVVALADLVLTWYPARFGDREWEFGTATTVFGGLPLFAMGLMLAVGAAVARGNLRLLRIWSVVLGVIAVVLLAVLLLYARSVPVALQTVTEPVLKVGLNKAILKTALQGVLYPAAFLWVATLGWKHARRA
jgi:hypothetical protein